MHDVVNKNSSDGPYGLVNKWTSKWTSRWASRWRVWGFNACDSISSREIFRKGPQLLFKLAFGVAFYMSLTYNIWYSAQISAATFSSRQSNQPHSKAGDKVAQGNVTGGLRMVVFGGGDVATPTLSSIAGSGQGCAWTEVMCKKVMLVPIETLHVQKINILIARMRYLPLFHPSHGQNRRCRDLESTSRRRVQACVYICRRPK